MKSSPGPIARTSETFSITSKIEESQQRVLNPCAKWRAMLLMDECDVFLEERSAHDLERHRLVSVFLRLLEYYKSAIIKSAQIILMHSI